MGRRRGGRGGGGGGRGGRGGGGGGGDDDWGGGGGGGREDQYGECFKSQDRDDRPSFSGRQAGGGGSAGGGKAGTALNFQRQVPKFLQKYQHLLGSKGGGGPSEDEPTVDEGGQALLRQSKGKGMHGDDDDEEEDAKAAARGDDIESEALRRAMAENPELAREFKETLDKRLAMAEATEEKERGNKLFGAKKFKEAIKSFTRCIELDSSNEVFYSNRSAAHASLEQWDSALEDAKRAVVLKPSWAKAHQRLGAAYMGLLLYSEAKEAYESAVKLDPDNQAVHTALQKAEMLEAQQAQDHVHKFRPKRREAFGGGAGAQGEEGKKKQKVLLSFDQDNEGEG